VRVNPTVLPVCGTQALQSTSEAVSVDDESPSSAGAASLLVTTTISAREGFNRRRRTGRAYNSFISGMKLAGTYRVVTLTTSQESLDQGKSIQDSFRALLGRCRRRGLVTGYCKVVERTKGGVPHIHVIFRGKIIPHWWLSQIWEEIHLSPVVWIQYVRGIKGVARYLAKYLSKDPIARLAPSWDWVWKGFRGDWRILCKWGYWYKIGLPDIVVKWEMMLTLYGLRPARDGPYLRGV